MHFLQYVGTNAKPLSYLGCILTTLPDAPANHPLYHSNGVIVVALSTCSLASPTIVKDESGFLRCRTTSDLVRGIYVPPPGDPMIQSNSGFGDNKSCYLLSLRVIRPAMEEFPPSYQSSKTALTEYWSIISEYVPSSDLCSASRVCQQWHAIFASLLWGNPASHWGIENDRVYGEVLIDHVMVRDRTHVYQWL